MDGHGTDVYLHLGRTLQTTFEDRRLQEPAATGLQRLVEK
eukprot:gene13015-38716_t